MLPARIHHYRDPTSVVIGLTELRNRGLNPRGLLFIALDTRGETYIALPDDLGSVESLRIGDKLTIKPPWEGRYFHFDSIHCLGNGAVLWNGDRRLGDAGSASEVARAVASWLRSQRSQNVFLGCTSHQPGAWFAAGQSTPVIDLHASGLVDVVKTNDGLLGRRIGEPTLFFLDGAKVDGTGIRSGWQPVYQSEVGNILLLERRMKDGSLVLSCERGLVEIRVDSLPNAVEVQRTELEGGGVGVLGRTDAGAFAVTSGVVEPWGLANLTPALLVGSVHQGLSDLPPALSRALTER